MSLFTQLVAMTTIVRASITFERRCVGIRSADTGIFQVPYRALTIGIILILSTVAFEGLAITTIAPTLAHSLQGIHLYGWIFSTFLLFQLIGSMVIGKQIDRHGVIASVLVSFSIFVIGIIIAALSFHMYMLIAGRALQGFGAGSLVTCVYYIVTVRYPDSLRTSILAAFSAAYVLPALIGPYVAGLISIYLSWRFVFWLVLPLIVLALCMTLPSFRSIQKSSNSEVRGGRKELYAILLAIGTGLLLTGLGRITDWLGVVLTGTGIAIMVHPLRRLLPQGTFTVTRGLPAIIVTRALYIACYFATESYVVLGLTKVRGITEDLAGLIVAAGALSWSGAAWVQARLDRRDLGEGRQRRIRIGLCIMIVGVSLVLTSIALSGSGVALALISQVITGFGVGLATPTIGAVALQLAEEGKEGEVSAALQFIDSFSIAVSIGISGALVALSESLQLGIFTGVMMALGLQLCFVVLSFVTSFRITMKAHSIVQSHSSM
jgi:MFS family permease